MRFITFCRSLLPNDKPNLNSIVLQNESALTQKLDIGYRLGYRYAKNSNFCLEKYFYLEMTIFNPGCLIISKFNQLFNVPV